ncbi:HTH-type transcriptional activator IlvY [Streptomyces profundus]|uniref:HTH-type transcriptional activator IlvY n=1 Tax=Streptomyces profundus TaxID=2867410 RepID=UPI001D16C56A|nr:HTH-type transcriptional activator IlvY [Streptomyces sp. MA3_2.13]UED84041.1 HTH-type transcriptional activator IlvY [Streptomyces sp. MA3_2.13]
MFGDHRDVRLFLHLAQTLNFGRTSLECHVSPATLTRSMQRLEAELGRPLFDRTPHGVTLTVEGQRFRAYALEALDRWQEYRQGHDKPSGLVGRLAVFATVTACQALLPALLSPFRAAHPQALIDLRTGDAAAALARLDEGDVDVAVAGVPARLPETLRSRTVATTELVFVTARDQPENASENALDGPFVLPHRGLVREAAERWFRARRRVPRVVAEPEGHEALLTLVALGYGTGVVPKLVLDTSATRGALSTVHVDPTPAALTIGLCVSRANLRRPLVAALWSLTAGNAQPTGA